MRAMIGRGWIVWAMAGILAGCQTAAGPSQSEEDSGSGHASAPTAVSERLVDEPARRVVRFSNGFTVILQQNKTAPVVAARIYIKAGSLTEQQYMGSGISHVVEHLVAGATSGKRKEDANQLLLQQIGGDSDAFTDYNETCYFITTTADKWPVALDLLVDWTQHADFTPQQFQREFKVVQREIEMDEAEAERVAFLRTLDTRYRVSPVRHPVVGYKTAFQKLTYEDCKEYYKEMYVPDNMVVSVAGDIDLDKAEGMILEQLKDIPRKKVQDTTISQEPLNLLPRRSVSHADIKQARVEWAFPTMNLYNPDLYATDTLASVLGSGESSILLRRLRDDLGLVTSISCEDDTPTYAQGALTVDAVLDPSKIAAAQDAVMKVLSDVAQNGVPADALERAKAQASASRVYADQTAEQQASRNAEDFLNSGSIDFTAAYTAHIQNVTVDDVKAMAQKYIQRDRMITTAVLPEGAKDPFGGPAGHEQTALSAPVVNKTVLKNGLTVLISRNPAAPLASFNLYTLGGLLAEDQENSGIGAAMMELMTRGTQTRSHQQIADYLDATGTTLGAESGNNSYLLSMQCLKEKAPEAFDLFADVALHPKFAPDELDKVRPLLLSAIDASTEDWFGEAYAAVRDAYYADSPYKRLPVGKADVISHLSAAAIAAQYQNYFLDPSKMVLSISGDIDPGVAAGWAQRFEGISQKSVGLHLSSTAASAGTTLKHTDKDSATVCVAYPPGIKVTDPDRFAVLVLQSYLGGYDSEGGSLLFETLRGKGLVYTVQAESINGPAGGMFLVVALGEPGNAQAILTDIQQLVEQVKKGEIPDAKFEAAKDQAVTGEELSKQTIADKSASQALNELLGLGYDEDAKFAAHVRAITKAQVIAAANKYLNAPVVVIVTPQAKSDAKK